ncbi:branched-chain amino acid ABC transporter permease [Pedosphaera parvula]|uniref:Inner-membrane translocator n=1 Tax=Pedosphaera parvula (strain Ellin514) TaxID=320771 RepID=B9XLC3_PEDPL|nr:branched-chain amino acid ABC transporter permease [Pedosphaera parvula]EEF59326.1 inner-membrane translocator [Pedosphaera parvula Ellin514]
MPTRSQIVLLTAIALSAVVALFSNQIDPYFLLVVTNVGINVILAVSLNLVNGYTGQFSLGHAGFMAVGAYTASAITLFMGPRLFTALGSQGIPAVAGLFLFALIAGGLVAALAGLIVGIPSLRLKGDYLAIVTLGFGEIIRVIFRNIEVLGGALGLNGIPSYTNFFWTFGVVAITTYVVVSMVNSTYGRGFLAVHDDEVAAEAMGINTTRYKIIAFVVGAFFAGVAGGLFAHSTRSIDPRGFDFMKSIEIVVMVILGGMGNTVGVIIAAVLLTLLPEFLRPIAEYRMMIYSLLLIVLMLARPQGLFTIRRKLSVSAGEKGPMAKA